jgi:glycosyltransferase involved in cell wall biosynthesis
MNAIVERSLASDSDLERALIIESGLFDEAAYVAQAGEESRHDPVGHYLSRGWRRHAMPNPAFPGFFVLPILGELLPDQPPLITWLTLQSAGRGLPENANELEQWAAKIRDSKLFDQAFYFAQLGPGAASLDPVVHYLLRGEQMGLLPSENFDPRYYADRYPDIAATGINLLLHFVEYGRAEGRFSRALAAMKPGCIAFDPDKENAILVVHDASRSGAPILGWNIAIQLSSKYNLFIVALSEGELSPEFKATSVEVYGPFEWERRNAADIEHALRSLFNARQYRYAIVNSAASHLIVESCARRFIPTVLLVHEFASYLGAGPSLITALDSATEIVFSADLVRQAAEEALPSLRSRSLHVLPQGRSSLPPRKLRSEEPALASDLSSYFAEHPAGKEFVVLGVGTVELRKGTDLFLAVAASVFRRNPEAAVHFVWVGDGYRPQEDFNYSSFLQEQIKRSRLEGHVTFIRSVDNLEPLYEAAGVFLLSSRLDPLPNVTIDASFQGLAVICFQRASGMAELMLSDPDTSCGVVDYLDVDAAAAALLRLAEDEGLRSRFSAAMKELALRTFDMRSYVTALDALGERAQKRMAQRLADAETLRADSSFDQDMFLGPAPVVETREETIVRYLTKGGECCWSALPSLSYRRRPSPGFNPRIYAGTHGCDEAGIDPLADFVRRGRPSGPWQLQVLLPPDPMEELSPPARFRVGIHAHLFYPELCPDLIARLKANRTPFNLFITTDTEAKRIQLETMLGKCDFSKANVRIVPNKGRDIGPLLTALYDDLVGYDLIGHFHGKRSPYVNTSFWGDDWREFLWQNLIGSLHPMMDSIAAAFAQSSDLGLVFPSDPNVCGWDKNKGHAAALASRMGWHGSLPEYFDFPVGTMFWARPEALRPLFQLGLTWDDYPSEPVAQDGTILHALERILTLSCTLSGFRHAVTHVPGVSWAPPS